MKKGESELVLETTVIEIDRTGSEEICQYVLYEANDIGLREWCETGCMITRGRAVGPYQIKRGTEEKLFLLVY